MDWDGVSDSAQVVHGQSGNRIRKESNTLVTFGTPDVADVGNNSGASGSNIRGKISSPSMNGTGGMGGAAIVNDNSSSFYDIPMPNSNQSSSDNEEMKQLRWNQEGSAGITGNVTSNKRQQKSNNICEKAQVESRLHQIRDYIGQTTNVMDRLQAAGTPQHLEQWFRLHEMLEGLRDSEIKLSTILQTFDKLKALEDDLDNDDVYNDNNSDTEEDSVKDEENEDSAPKSGDPMIRKNELKVKVEESQKKLVELREQQASLLALKQKAQEQLKASRASQNALSVAQTQQRDEDPSLQNCRRLDERLQSLHNFYEAQNELAQMMGISNDDSEMGEVMLLQNKLEELQNKKIQINQMASRGEQSNSAPNFMPVPIHNNNNDANGVTNNCSNNNNNITNYNTNSDGRSIEDKQAELSALKEQLARMQNALANLSKPASHSSSKSSSSFNSSLLQNSSQEIENNFVDDEEPVNILQPSSNLKQDNRAQAISQSQQKYPVQQQQQPLRQSQHSQHSSGSVLSPAAVQSAAVAAESNDIITPSLMVQQQQQQIQTKSLKLQEAKARLHHLQELLSLVEEFREAGKPVPDKILSLLNSPNGPLTDDDNLDA